MAVTERENARSGAETLLEVGRELFLERGYANVSMQQIAERAGMTKGAPYYHFQNKEALFRQVAIRLLRELKDRIVGAMSGSAPLAERLERTLREANAISCGEIAHWMTELQHVLPQETMSGIAQEGFGVADPVDLLLPVFEQARDAGELHRVSPEVASRVFNMLLFASIDGSKQGSHVAALSEQEMNARVAEAVDVFLHGIA